MAKNQKVLKSLAVAALATSAIVPVASANTPTTYSDIVTEVNGQLTSITQEQYNLAVALGKKPTVEYVKVNNKFYSIAEYNLKVATVGATKAFEELTKTGTVATITPSVGAVDGSGNITNNAPVTGELKVESVSAINGTTIAAGTATELKFLVNGKEELTAKEFEEKYEGYSVTFKYNKTTAGFGTDGKVNVAAGTFKYAVQVEDAEGNLVPEEVTAADFVEVKAVAADKAVAVNEIGLVDAAGKAWGQAVLADSVTIVATKYVNALGQDQDAKNASEEAIVTAPTIKSVKSSDVTVAYWDATSKTIKVLNDGTVTFTVEFEGIEAKSTITFDAKVAQEIGSVVTEDAKVAAGSDATLVFKVLDQDGETYLGSEDLYYTVKQAEGDDVQGTVTPSAGKASITKTFVKGDNTITIFADSDRKEKLGTIKVTAVDVTDALPDTYTLSFADEKVTSLDLNEDKDAGSLVVDVKAFIDGIEVAANKGIVVDEYELKAKSSNKNVPVTLGDIVDGKLTVSLPEGAKVGTATVDLYTVEGQLETKVATITVEVKNTTPKFTTLTLKKETKVDATQEDLKAAVIAAVVEGTLEEGALEAKHIASVTKVEGNGVVIVKIADLYGGALITLDATFEKAEEPVVDPDAPVVNPDAPVVDPDAPVVNPDAPVVDPDAPVVDPDAPVVDPDAPVVDPDAPVVNPDAPVVNPDAPVVDPDAPVVDPDAPVVNPDAPVVDPDAPVVNPDAPVVNPDAPVVNPDAPVVNPDAPVVNPDAPVVDPDAPVVDPDAPVVDPDAPVVNPDAPVVDPDAPVVDPDAPVVNPDAPVVNPDAPVVDPDAPVVDPDAPVDTPVTIIVDYTTLQITASESTATVTYDVEGVATEANVTVSVEGTSLVITFADDFDVTLLGDSFTIEIDGKLYTATKDQAGNWTLTETTSEVVNEDDPTA